MSGSLRTVTYNVQCRSWGMEVGADESIPPSTTAEERAVLIAANLLASPHDYDVVCLNEVFDEDSRAIFTAVLQTRWPYAITKADVYDLHVGFPGKPPISLNAAALALNLTGIGHLGELIDLGAPKAEDSGLMLFSRWPFELRPITEQLLSLLNPLAASELTPLGFPVVGFHTYRASTGNDAWAAKGVLHARIRPDQWTTYDVFASHTQADSEKVSENKTERTAQFAEVAEFVRDAVGGDPGDRHLFFMGDMNVPGGQAEVAITPDTAEWEQQFATSGFFLDTLVDVWGREQCRGGSFPRDPGYTAQTVYPPPSQRLDYFFRNGNSDMIVQHLYVDHALAELPAGADGIGYLSDHRPLGADLFPRREFNSPERGEPLTAAPDARPVGYIADGEVHWYWIAEDGTYNIRLFSGGDRATYTLYLDTDLSRPREQYREEEHPDFGPKFVIASAPFLIKVSTVDRYSEAEYELWLHRHLGAEPWDAIDLIPGKTRHEAFPDPGILLSTDGGFAPWNDDDTMWFTVDSTRLGVPGPFDLSVTVTPDDGIATDLEVHVGLDDGSGTLVELAAGGPTTGSTTLTWSADPSQRFYVTVARRDVNQAAGFSITTTSPVTLLLGGQRGLPQIVCCEETSGLGSDDTSCSLDADGVRVHSISNHQMGDMDDEDVRDLHPWITDTVPYAQGLVFTLTEEDDIDDNDVGTRGIPTLPPHDLAIGDQLADGVTVTSAPGDQTFRVTASIDVDDGRYEFRHTLARWHEKA